MQKLPFYMKRLRLWAVAFWQWIAKGKTVFIFILVTLTTLFLGIFVWRTEFSIRTAGYALQLFGMIIAIRSLLKIPTHFHQPTFFSLFVDWLKQFPSWNKGQTISTDETFRNQNEFYPGRVEAWQPDRPDQSPEDRIDTIVKNLDWIRLELGKLQNRQANLSESHELHKKQVSEEIISTKHEVNSFLESLHTSDLLPALVGLVWLTVGITLSTFSPDLCKWLE